MSRVLRRLQREPAVLIALLGALVQEAQGADTWEQVATIAVGVVVRFLVSPAYPPKE